MNDIPIKNENGSTAILMSILVLTVMLVISLSASKIVVNGLEMGVAQIYSVKAFFASEAGTEKYLWEIRKNNIDMAAYACDQGDYLCFDSESPTGGIDGCFATTSDCAVSHDQRLSNEATYFMRYGEMIQNNSTTTIITTYGDFKDSRRVTEVRY